MTTWILSVRRQPGTVIVAAVGDTDPPSAEWRGIVLREGELTLEVAPRLELTGGVELPPGEWHHIAATYDGVTARLYLDGRECGALEAKTVQVAARIDIAPTAPGAAAGAPHFGGSLAGLALEPYALDAQAVRSLADARPDFSLVTFDQVGVGWPLQEHAWRGLQAPQDPWTLPHGGSALRARRTRCPSPRALRAGWPPSLRDSGRSMHGTCVRRRKSPTTEQSCRVPAIGNGNGLPRSCREQC